MPLGPEHSKQIKGSDLVLVPKSRKKESIHIEELSVAVLYSRNRNNFPKPNH
jgi:hypothetical protein